MVMAKYTVYSTRGGIYYENDDDPDDNSLLFGDNAKNWLLDNKGGYEVVKEHETTIHNLLHNITPKPKEYFAAKDSKEFYSKNKIFIDTIKQGLKSVPKSSEDKVIVKGCCAKHTSHFTDQKHDIIYRGSIGDCNIKHLLQLKAHLITSDKTNEMTKDILTYLSNFTNQKYLGGAKAEQTTETPIWVDKNQLSYIILQVVKQSINNLLDIPKAFQEMTGVLVSKTKKPMFDLYKRPPEDSRISSIHNSNNEKSNFVNNTPAKSEEIKKEKAYDKNLTKSYKVR